ncbi:cytidylate kinase-like family protein [Hespellia stercorisuis]|uniref:Cytidylate kinase n=1 Tax=Hespellia stercorisuis DSM 15480 TaxID=1121950 RepID=A0A1M6Q0L4_9FIRM|nr:cytidylate kinase-like family protein [Hespellia stercorisuis]SHK13724.1 Cytidylate kinase [Hespellia stercorisuis DSM 15480]
MKLVITMSRRFGTGTSVIAKELSERLDIPVYTKDFILKELRDKEYASEAEIIRELAKEPCIIVGRCASDILKDRLNVLNIYVYAEKEDRIHRIMELESLSYDDAKEMVEKTDAERAEYYHEHTGRTWGDVNDYHMILNTSELGIDNCANILMQYFEKLEYI